MTLNKNNDPLALDSIYRMAIHVALDGGNGEQYFIKEAYTQGVDIPERLRGYYKTQLNRYWWRGWKMRALRVATVILIVIQLAFCTGLLLAQWVL
ncbi:hypothetical protein NE562_08770 [Butyricicoccus faecihominis]|uniref:hypothetical protein n=1 Tax=Butyricicoccus faecihominis TaxID=1712515 RepID=UPI00247969DD|nr:hypothetical protein [Butyricicoccus faecihominis]MCQ5129749.1 hypothetical protein [Butyricicoccus faecihominis]